MSDTNLQISKTHLKIVARTFSQILIVFFYFFKTWLPLGLTEPVRYMIEENTKASYSRAFNTLATNSDSTLSSIQRATMTRSCSGSQQIMFAPLPIWIHADSGALANP